LAISRKKPAFGFWPLVIGVIAKNKGQSKTRSRGPLYPCKAKNGSWLLAIGIWPKAKTQS
jgi:hypothetical protein